MDPRSPEHNKLVDEEDDEEDVIIYKEQTVQVPFPLSQVSAAQPEMSRLATRNISAKLGRKTRKLGLAKGSHTRPR